MANKLTVKLRTIRVLIKWFSFLPPEMYYCEMENALIEMGNQIFLEDGGHYFYTVKPVEIRNILGASIAILDEYIVTNSTGEIYKLYKTKEGNWYDMPEANSQSAKPVLLALKLAINAKTNPLLSA
jgi:hypothetical protein